MNKTILQENMDEFYPFGAVIDNQSNVKPISVFFEEYPDSQTLIQQLEEVIMSSIYKNISKAQLE